MGQMVSACTSSGSAHGLFRAAKDGNVEEVRRQLRLDPWLHTHHAFSSGETAWHAAAGAGHVGVLAALLECAVEHGHESGGGGRPTSAASHQRRRGNRIQQQEQQQQQEGEGNQRQEERASGNAAPAAQEEDDAGWALNQTNDKGQTPLMFAAFAGHPSAVQWLLDKGADLKATDRCGRRVALHYAALHGCHESVSALLGAMTHTEAALYVDTTTISMFTALHYAAAANSAAAARILLAAGANMMQTSSMYETYDLVACPGRSTPLHVAAKRGSFDAALAILQSYHENSERILQDPRRRLDAESRTPHQVAVSNRHPMLAELLHPNGNLDGLFATGSPDTSGAGAGAPGGAPLPVTVPRLSKLAGAAVRRQLVDDVQAAAACIEAYKLRHPQERDPEAMLETQELTCRPADDEPCCPLRMPSQFVYAAGAGGGDCCAGGSCYARGEDALLPVVQCTVCLDDTYCLVTEPCRHRICPGCARDVSSRAKSMPLPCAMCRRMVVQFRTPVC